MDKKRYSGDLKEVGTILKGIPSGFKGAVHLLMDSGETAYDAYLLVQKNFIIGASMRDMTTNGWSYGEQAFEEIESNLKTSEGTFDVYSLTDEEFKLVVSTNDKALLELVRELGKTVQELEKMDGIGGAKSWEELQEEWKYLEKEWAKFEEKEKPYLELIVKEDLKDKPGDVAVSRKVPDWDEPRETGDIRGTPPSTSHYDTGRYEDDISTESAVRREDDAPVYEERDAGRRYELSDYSSGGAGKRREIRDDEALEEESAGESIEDGPVLRQEEDSDITDEMILNDYYDELMKKAPEPGNDVRVQGESFSEREDALKESVENSYEEAKEPEPDEIRAMEESAGRDQNKTPAELRADIEKRFQAFRERREALSSEKQKIEGFAQESSDERGGEEAGPALEAPDKGSEESFLKDLRAEVAENLKAQKKPKRTIQQGVEEAETIQAPDAVTPSQAPRGTEPDEPVEEKIDASEEWMEKASNEIKKLKDSVDVYWGWDKKKKRFVGMDKNAPPEEQQKEAGKKESKRQEKPDTAAADSTEEVKKVVIQETINSPDGTPQREIVVKAEAVPEKPPEEKPKKVDEIPEIKKKPGVMDMFKFVKKPTLLKVLDKIDGKKSIREIAKELGLEHEETRKIVKELYDEGYVNVRVVQVEEKKVGEESGKDNKNAGVQN